MWLWRLRSPKSAGRASRLETQKEPAFHRESEGHLLENSVLLEGELVFCSIQAFN